MHTYKAINEDMNIAKLILNKLKLLVTTNTRK